MLMVEHINCEKGTNEDGVGVVKVSVVIRAIPAPVDYHRPFRHDFVCRGDMESIKWTALHVWVPWRG